MLRNAKKCKNCGESPEYLVVRTVVFSAECGERHEGKNARKRISYDKSPVNRTIIFL